MDVIPNLHYFLWFVEFGVEETISVVKGFISSPSPFLSERYFKGNGFHFEILYLINGNGWPC